MQTHPLVILSSGPAWDEKSSTGEQLLTAHQHYVGQLSEEGKLGAAGPIDAPDDLLGLVIFKAIPPAETQRLLGDDPAVQAGLLKAEYHTWWSSDHVLPW
jgi:uncharacterized protein YciI